MAESITKHKSTLAKCPVKSPESCFFPWSLAQAVSPQRALGGQWKELVPFLLSGWVRALLKGSSTVLQELFFLLAAAWVGPGRSALQSAEQW